MVASKLVLLVLAVAAAVASVTAQTMVQDVGRSEVRVTMHAPASATPVSAQAAVDMTQSQLVAARLRKLWPTGDVAVLEDNSDRTPDGNELLGHYNTKYGVYDRYSSSQHLKDREDLPPMATPEDITESGLPREAEDYRTIYRGANRGDFDANIDNPEALESMLGALWGKRWHHMTKEEQDANARNSNTIVMRASPASSERISMRMSSDGSVDKFVAIADDSAVIDAAVAEAKKFPLPSNEAEEFKPKTTWFGPRVSGAALDVTGVNVSDVDRVPNAPPKPPVPSYVIPDFHNASKLADNEAPVTVIETIRVTPESRPNGIKATENVFTPIMAAPTTLAKPAFIVG